MGRDITLKLTVQYVLLALILGGMLFLLSPFFSALAIGLILAIVLDPVHEYLISKGLSSGRSAFLIVLVFALIVLIPATVIIVRGSETLVDFFQTNIVVGFEEKEENQPTLKLLDEGTLFSGISEKISNLFGISPAYITNYIKFSIEKGGTFVFSLFQRFLKRIPQSSLGIFILLLTIHFSLADKWKLRQKLRKYSPFTNKKMRQLAVAFRRTSKTVIWTNLIGGGVQVTIFGLATLIFNTGNFFLIIFSVFLMSFVPILGTAPISIILASNYFFQGNLAAGIGWLVVGTIAGLSDNIVKPFVVRSGVRTHAFLGFLTVLGGMMLLGVPGLFLGPFIAGLFSTCLPILSETD